MKTTFLFRSLVLVYRCSIRLLGLRFAAGDIVLPSFSNDSFQSPRFSGNAYRRAPTIANIVVPHVVQFRPMEAFYTCASLSHGLDPQADCLLGDSWYNICAKRLFCRFFPNSKLAFDRSNRFSTTTNVVSYTVYQYRERRMSTTPDLFQPQLLFLRHFLSDSLLA